MSSKSRTRCARLSGPAIATAVLLASGGGALAQASGCNDLQAFLLERKAIAEKLSSAGKKQLDAKVACTDFGRLVQNGNSLIKWSAANKEWCQIPDSFIDGIKADHGKATEIRGRACGVAAKQAEMEKNGGGGGGLLGGNGLSGAMALPQGAL